MHHYKKSYLRAITIAGAMLGSSYAFADCTYPTLASNVTEGIELYNAGLKADPTPTKNTTVCVDVPVQLMKNKMVYNMDVPATKDGTANGSPNGLRHMWLMGSANIARAKGVKNKTGLDILPELHIKGIIHGSALSWALNDEWWQSQVDEHGNQLYPEGNPNKESIDKVLALQSKGLDIQLEVCAVSLMGKGLSDTDVYPGILVNQGAFGRMSALSQEGYVIVSEGWVDNDKKHKGKYKDRD